MVVPSVGNFNIFPLVHTHELMNIASVGVTGQLFDEIVSTGPKNLECLKVDNIELQKIVSSSPLVTVRLRCLPPAEGAR